MNKYYKCSRLTKTGKQIEQFFSLAQQAAARADEYAKNMGAAAYIQPVQYFEGGVDFLEFDKEPDARIWRKRTDLGDTPLYEPNCVANRGALVMDDDRTTPSNTWRRVYQNRHLTWPEVKPLFPLEYWLAVVNAYPSDNKESDWAKVEEKLAKKFFMSYLDFTVEGMCNVPKSKEKYVRQAVMAERLRLTLPVVTIDSLYVILQPAKDESEKKSRNRETPTLFIYKDEFFVGIDMSCVADDLVEVTSEEYKKSENAALGEVAENSVSE